MVVRGDVRIPVFQRGLRWGATNVIELFDSIYRGYPIGSLLLRAGPASAGEVRIGPLTVFGAETGRALWVVDGQQRLTSLAVGLGRRGELPRTPSDPFVVYFDPTDQSFRSPPSDGNLPTTWVPLPHLLNASELSEWILAWPHGRDPSLRAVVFEAGRRLREYKVPSYVIETDDEDTLRKIFHRVNTAGEKLDWKDVYDALYSHKTGAPASLADLASELEALGMGRPDEESQLLPSLVAMRGLDVTRTFDEHVRANPKALEGAAAEAAPVLRKVLGFLRLHAEIPHLRLLPYSAPIIVLTRFFREHPEPNPRTETLLVRWIWRTFLSPALDDRTLRRRGIATVTSDEEASVQAMLNLVGDAPRESISIGDRFDARSAHSRLVMLGLASLRPKRLDRHAIVGEGTVDLAALILDADKDAFRPVFPLAGGLTSSPANRVLLPGPGSARGELAAFIEAEGPDHEVLRSHAIAPATAAALIARNLEDFISGRARTIEGAVERLSARLAEWGRNDRPSIDYLLSQVGEK